MHTHDLGGALWIEIECLTLDRGVAGSSLTGGIVLCPWARHFILCLVLVQFREGPYRHAVIHLQFWAYGSWDSLFPISMSPTENLLVQNTIFNDKSAIPLHPGTHWNINFASQRQNYAQKMQDAQVKYLRHDWKIVDWDVKSQNKQTNKWPAKLRYDFFYLITMDLKWAIRSSHMLW